LCEIVSAVDDPGFHDSDLPRLRFLRLFPATIRARDRYCVRATPILVSQVSLSKPLRFARSSRFFTVRALISSRCGACARVADQRSPVDRNHGFAVQRRH
jgi:hypothetical protein